MNSFADDRHSGSTDVARSFLDELERWAALDTSAAPADFRQALVLFLRAAQASQPSLALIHQLVLRAIEVTDTGVSRGERPADLRAHLAASCASERDDLAAATTAVARQAVDLLTERGAWVATLSASAAVRAALLEAHARGRAPRGLVAESRPALEGRDQAAALAAAGIPTWLVVDAALPLLLSQARMVWIGADAVTDTGVVAKIGAYGMALAAREHSVPVYALASRRKFLPASTAALRIVEMPPAEVWEDESSGVRARNIYFENVPLDLLRGVVVEDGVLGGSETRATALDRALPPEWAAAP